MYLTPAQFRARDFGVKVDDLLDVDLASHLRRAAEAVHLHTGAPMLPVPHDFRGGTIVGETHVWPIDPYDRRLHHRVFPKHRPVIEVTSARIYATETQYVTFDASELHYEVSEGWVEPASVNLTSYGLFGAAMLPFVGLERPFLSLDYTYGWIIPFTERIYYSDIGNVWRASTGHWRSDPVTVKVNGVAHGNFTVDRVEGTITFTSNIPSEDDAVDVTGVGSLPSAIPEAQGIIVAARITEKNLVAQGLGGLRAIRVAELSLERDYRRQDKGTSEVSIPPEAAELLAPYKLTGVVFG